MSRKIPMIMSIPVTFAAMTLSPNAAFAQFPPPPPMAGPPPIGAGGPPAFAGRPPLGPGGAPRGGLSGPPPHPGEGPAPRGALAAAGRVGPASRGGLAVPGSARAISVTYNRFGDHGRYGGYEYGHRAAYAAGAYAAGATAGYTYGRSRDGYSSESDCYYVYRRYRRVLACD